MGLSTPHNQISTYIKCIGFHPHPPILLGAVSWMAVIARLARPASSVAITASACKCEWCKKPTAVQP